MKDEVTRTPKALKLPPESIFLVWGPPSHGPRSKVFGRELGIEVHFLQATIRRGALVAPYKYAVQVWKTVRLLASRRPQIVFVQSPPSYAALLVALYSALTGTRFVVDAHSDAMQSPWWTRPRWLYRVLARRALATIVTNEHFAGTIESWGGRALVIRDIPTSFPEGGTFETATGFAVAVVNTFATDEPLDAVLDAAAGLPSVAFYVTGRIEQAPRELIEGAPANVHFTGFLDDADYYELLRRADTVMCLTTRDNTMQRGACEALSLARPIITSDWPLLRSYFHRGAVHVAATPGAINDGVARMQAEYDRYRREIVEQQIAQQDEWAGASATLAELLGGNTTGADR